VNAPVFLFLEKTLEFLGGYRTHGGNRKYIEVDPIKVESDTKNRRILQKNMLSFEEKGILEYEGNEEGKWEL